RWAFSIYDIDGNGFISRQEMHEIVQAMTKMLRITSDSESKTEDDPDPLKTRLEVVFSKMDANKDGNLSLEEFLGIYFIVYPLFFLNKNQEYF
ncbi:neuron-specific calcium-binding protein hippocalcin-like, partial [Symsagittifera roscoffensis]|uniref:neuron-specific calcium-binding protein hippocalcin-like n=1 Tax=Symsagittifera roscoffensis TaxID=84072 RepID=UPI00307B70B8